MRLSVRNTNKDEGVDCIVTRNKKDFSNSQLPVYTPAEFIQALKA